MRFVLLCLLLLGLPALADVYTYIDSEGNRVFTDQPRGNAKKVEIAPTNGMDQTAPPTVRVPVPAAAPTPVASYQLLRILVPEPDATVQEGSSGNLIVTLTSDPALMEGHNYRVLLDGAVVGTASRSPVIPLNNLDRGTHQLAAEIIDAEGRILERTPSQPVHIVRTSLESKRRANPCKKDDYGVRPECPLKDKPEEEDDDIPYVPFV
ncbi:DUF4124 domain-containing protein [Pseudomonas turukhanskensis]|uniref:Penicillin-binding protein n=1 Tax=Pseudomonas turukhanskensis TaxID=1806536 RepID=A0A9W6K8A0_9PSED|nr:DUF4124 domain-containing protein [Pseudomonas turukhanskensis]GLK89894.1 penicillin-binding protein [Pseudomonas turukhanskensis]